MTLLRTICYTHHAVNKLILYFLRTCLILATFFIVMYLFLALSVARHAEQDTKLKSDSILVLGARSYINGKYNPCLVARMDHAVDLYKSEYAPKILVSGGNDKEDGVNEAETMRKIAMEKGVRPEDILMEKSATSTYENFHLSQDILKKNKLQSLIIVTEPFHIARASLVADNLGLPHTSSPAKENSCWLPNKYLTKYFLKEPFAIMVYKLQKKL